MSEIRPRHSSWQTGMFVHLDVDRNDLDPYEFRVYAHLCCRANEELRTWVKQQTIAVLTGISPRKVRDALQTLEDRGWIQREPRYREDGSRATDNILVLGPPSRPARYEPLPEELQRLKPARESAPAAPHAGGANRHHVPGVPAPHAGGPGTTCLAEVIPSEVEPSEVQKDSELRSVPRAGEGGRVKLKPKVRSVKAEPPAPEPEGPAPKAPERNAAFDAAARFIVGSEDPQALSAAGSQAGKVVKHLKAHGVTAPEEITRVGRFIRDECFVSPGVIKYDSWE
ncbi:helix-turn-helix domain-containing protein [Deinococcus taeanensis]|uniref:helix-turn-helix domain-containing protein n=1 Tax=Deinococcus taeanensis TaxID=2737050 RepID=UPI001CDCBB34|nr:helix-turn-helix domain-containing protein [Deinococcus taeanensis]UBV42599.1 helix-turn-helix domain-containing protein [Deinococcus taeanensis]